MKLRPPLTNITEADFRRMIAGGRVLQLASGKPAVVLDASGTSLIKLVAREPGFSSDRIWPYGYRFYFNSQKLLKHGIEAPRIDRYCVVRPSGEHVLVYGYLAGHSIQSLAEEGGLVDEEGLAAFYAELHAKGIYFRSIHPGNILQLEGGRFGLIDVTDTRFYSKPLSVHRRVRNLVYAWTRRRTRHVFPAERVERLLEHYRKHAALDARAEACFMLLMQRELARAAAPQ